MNRLFKIARRRPHIVDLYMPLAAAGSGIDGYRVKWNANFDGVFADLFTVSNVGFLDPNVNRNVIEAQPTAGREVRIVFDPTTYSIPDSVSFWIKTVQCIAGVEQSATLSPPTLVMPDQVNKGVGLVSIRGNATGATSSATSMQLDLPFLMQDFAFHNEDTTNYLYVTGEAGGAEVQIRPSANPISLNFKATEGSLYVRGATPAGAAAAVPFSATFTLAFPR